MGNIQCAGVVKICKTIHINEQFLKCIVYCLYMYVEHKMYDCKCLCCPKIGITQDQYRLIAKDVNDVADDDSTRCRGDRRGRVHRGGPLVLRATSRVYIYFIYK